MQDKIVIAVICGTKREGRRSIHAAKWVAEQGKEREDLEIIFVDPKDIDLPPDGEAEDGENAMYKDITVKADAFYIVTPEYNHSFPGSLKRLLDSEFENYKHKPVATAGVSDGAWGGVRVCEALLPVYHTMWMVPIKPELYFPRVQDIFDDQGTMKPEYLHRYTVNVGIAFDELVWMARALKAARANK
ncbi:MAG TPA: NAD(P)H-dependent oxidoreductase [Candidatus Saccharimonadales bacterium]|nr:NAD(P)H-dependent oxidoreductase [Candidatus Saccharimonadales bacterium]